MGKGTLEDELQRKWQQGKDSKERQKQKQKNEQGRRVQNKGQRGRKVFL